jgi:UDP-GlcNAc:undecaprenyl-phosphate GlcNAc-1-phosphate transferase
VGVRTYISVFLGAALLAEMITPIVIRLAWRVGAVDKPGVRSIHTRPIPRVGGVAIYLAAMGLIVCLPFVDSSFAERFRDVRLQVITLLCSATGIFLIGLVDDLWQLPARVKFLGELLGAGVLCLVGVRISNIGLGDGFDLQLGWLGWPITMLWIVGITNAVNMSDGLDGLAAGVSAIACGVIAIFVIHHSTLHSGPAQSNDIMMALSSLALLGSLSGFLFFNFNPAKVFMGDCGSLFIGFAIASTSVMCVSKSAALVGLTLPALALGIPIFDTLFAMLRRFLERRSLFAPDRSHFHHLLLGRGLQQRQAVILVYGLTLLTAGLGLLAMVRDDASSLVVFGGIVLLNILLFRFVGVIRLRETLTRLREKYHRESEQHSERRRFEDLQLRFQQAHDPNGWWGAICEAADQMDFAWVSLKTTYGDGRTEEEIWLASQTQPKSPRIVTMTIPLGKKDGADASQQVEVGIRINGSVEAAGRRALLFGRLMDESTSMADRRS